MGLIGAPGNSLLPTQSILLPVLAAIRQDATWIHVRLVFCEPASDVGGTDSGPRACLFAPRMARNWYKNSRKKNMNVFFKIIAEGKELSIQRGRLAFGRQIPLAE